MKCPICNKEMTKHNGAWFCNENMNTEHPYVHCVVVLCNCGRRMIPESFYSNKEEKFNFWHCPHCHNRG